MIIKLSKNIHRIFFLIFLEILLLDDKIIGKKMNIPV